jgi:hypothetical protein
MIKPEEIIRRNKRKRGEAKSAGGTQKQYGLGYGYDNTPIVRHWNDYENNRGYCRVCGDRLLTDFSCAELDNGYYVIYTCNNPRCSERDKSIVKAPFNPNCFIATAAYGTPFDSKIDTLRNWRDNFLLQHILGQWFVRQYYKHSPPIAKYISTKDSLRKIVRLFLTPIISLLKNKYEHKRR